MIDQQSVERAAERFRLPEGSFERLELRRARKHRNQRLAAGALGIAVFALAAIGFVRLLGSEGTPASDPRSPFAGTWVSTSDPDGGTQTMIVEAGVDDAVEIVVTDDVATVCSGTPSTMTGTGRIEAGTALVIPAPVYTCDDGSEPQALSGPPLAEQLRDLTFVLDPETETLTDNLDGVWVREGVELPSPEPTTSGGMWPQSSLKEVRQAQERADAGDPDYTWQVDPELVEFDGLIIEEPGQVEIVDRFLREVLGWEAYTVWDIGRTTERPHNIRTDQRYLRCAPGRANPLYPDESCAPTIDDLHYESVSIDLAQLDRQGDDGVWVVTGWELTAPFAQSDPAPLQARATGYLEEFLAARTAGNGAEGLAQIDPESTTVPLLYATSSGAPYERYEIERVDGPRWPYGGGTLRLRLFANGDATVVEQEIRWFSDGTLSLVANTTTENGQPVAVPYTSADDEVTVSAPGPWTMWWPDASHVADVGVWFGLMERGSFESRTSIGFVDPVAYDAWCGDAGGSPLLSGPADAASIAQQVIADPNFETTTPVATRVGGRDAVMMDVALAPGGEPCGIGMIIIARWIHELWEQGLRLRLYLVDLPESMSVETLAITVVAPEERFDAVIEETAPIIDSIEFHAP